MITNIIPALPLITSAMLLVAGCYLLIKTIITWRK